MPEFNPYAAPEAELNPLGKSFPILQRGEEIWTDGKTLIMAKSAILPDRCVKCDEPAHGYRLKRNLSWISPWLYLLVLVAWLIFLIVYFIARKTALIHVGLCEAHRSRRRQAIVIGWTSFALGVALFAAGLRFEMWPIFVGGLIGGFVGVVYGAINAQIVSAVKIDDYRIRLKGVGPRFLARFPFAPDSSPR